MTATLTQAEKNANLRRLAAHFRTNFATFNQMDSTRCTVGGAVNVLGLGYSGGSDSSRLRLSNATGIPFETLRAAYITRFPGELATEYTLAANSSNNRAKAEVAAKFYESFIREETPAPADNSAKVIELLIFAGKLSQSDVDKAKSLLSA